MVALDTSALSWKEAIAYLEAARTNAPNNSVRIESIHLRGIPKFPPEETGATFQLWKLDQLFKTWHRFRFIVPLSDRGFLPV